MGSCDSCPSVMCWGSTLALFCNKMRTPSTVPWLSCSRTRTRGFVGYGSAFINLGTAFDMACRKLCITWVLPHLYTFRIGVKAHTESGGDAPDCLALGTGS